MPDMMGYSQEYANSNVTFDWYFSLFSMTFRKDLDTPFSLKTHFEWFTVVIVLKLLHQKKVLRFF